MPTPVTQNFNQGDPVRFANGDNYLSGKVNQVISVTTYQYVVAWQDGSQTTVNQDDLEAA